MREITLDEARSSLAGVEHAPAEGDARRMTVAEARAVLGGGPDAVPGDESGLGGTSGQDSSY